MIQTIFAPSQNINAQAKPISAEYLSEGVCNFGENPYRCVGRIDLLDPVWWVVG